MHPKVSNTIPIISHTESKRDGNWSPKHMGSSRQDEREKIPGSLTADTAARYLEGMPGCLGRIRTVPTQPSFHPPAPTSLRTLFQQEPDPRAAPNALSTNQENPRHPRSHPTPRSEFADKSPAHSKVTAPPNVAALQEVANRDNKFRGAHQLARYYTSWSV